MTREEGLAIYHAGPETVLCVLLELDARILASEQRGEDLQAQVAQLHDQLAKNSAQQQQTAFHRWVSKARSEEPAGKEQAPLGRSARTCGADAHDGRKARS